MSDERELVERLATIDATPRARWVAELRRDLDAAWDTDDLGDLDSLRTTTVTLLDNEPTLSEPSNRRRWAGLIAAAAVVLVVGVLAVFDRDDAPPADQPTPTVTVPPTTPPRALFDTRDEQFVPGTYFVDEVDGTPTPRIFVTIGSGWTNFLDEGLDKMGATPRTYSPEDDVGFITFSRPEQVYLDACHLDDGFHPGPVTTLDGLVAALSEQGGWADVTTPSAIFVDGYPGKTFQRTAPAVLSGCPNMSSGHMRLPELGGDGLKSWQNEDGSNFGGAYYEPDQLETLMVLDIDGTVVVINANLWAGTSAADRAEFADVLDSVRIERVLPNVPGGGPLEPGTYYVDEVSGTPTPRIFATLGAGWRDGSNVGGWELAKGGPWLGEAGFDEFLEHEIGFMAFSHPVDVYADACHWDDGYYPGPVDTLDGLVAALTEQQGWAEVTAPSDISIDGYVGKAFQRTAPADMSDCATWATRTRVMPPSADLATVPAFRSWDNRAGEGGAGFYYEPAEIETLWVLDLGGTLVVINAGAWALPSAGADADFAADVLNSIRIERA
jgi:hypothetical protein